METLIEKGKTRVAGWFWLCPVRHILIAVSALFLAAYFGLRHNAGLMAAICGGFVRPYHRFMARLTGHLSFSAGELIIVIAVLAALDYTVIFIIGLVKRPEKRKRTYRFCMTCLAAFGLIYSGFCLFWGVYYYTSDFEAQSGIRAQPLSVSQLETVTRYFTDLANDYGNQVQRDENGLFAESIGVYFDHSTTLYHAAEEQLPCLTGDPVRAKPFFFSLVMSYIDFTGFYFPFTGEANINIDAPECLIPATIAHEQAHQRGVAQEDEANFCAVLASLTDADPVYCYSASLLAYIHLSNALYSADYDAWAENYQRLTPEVRADLDANNSYWQRFKTPVRSVSNTVYTGFLQSYGQTLGLKTYGKCVDLLVTYYYDLAAAAADESVSK